MNDNINGADNVMKNIDTIKMLSGMMSGGGNDTEKIINAIATAKSLGIFGNDANNNQVNDRVDVIASDNSEPQMDGTLQSESIRAVKAAIPFLNRDYQKHLFLAVKLMEMNEEFDRGAMNLQCQSIVEGSEDEQRESMLRAVRGQLGNENGKKLDVVLKMMEARRIAARLK